jgi:tRNA uridine 5-carboxymethylaminomethyl modification enzyme
MIKDKYDIIVIGGGHAGIEAAYASSKIGCDTLLLTMNLNNIGKPSCNPSIGGTAKGHLVKEIDALGGAMGVLADKAGIHFKMLNKSKGPAVWSPRAQIDKDLYPKFARNFLENVPNLTLAEGQAKEIIIKDSKVVGIVLNSDERIYAKAIVFCSGTFLNGLMFTGETISSGGRFGEDPSLNISDLLKSYGVEIGRLKTGTPPRIFADSIDYSKVEIQTGDDNPLPFSNKTDKVENKIVCYQSSTNQRTHDILKTGFDKSPMFKGVIQGVGPRYCPSIEDKIARFAERDSHKIVLEPEGLSTNSVYVNGYSTSLPESVQIEGLKTIPGLENIRLKRAGYAIEYDYFPSYQLKFTLESKAVEGLFFAGQLNGSSGYEEAAGQGLIAGINAALKVKDKGDFSLSRSEAYIGVMIDDLVNKSSDEPYRLFTSLAEYRLLLRQDNADIRLSKYAFDLGLIDEATFDRVNKLKDETDSLTKYISENKISAEIANNYLSSVGESLVLGSTDLASLLKRGAVTLEDLLVLKESNNVFSARAKEQVQINSKYEGYIKRQLKEVEYFSENEKKRIPNNFDYDKVQSLSAEARQKLMKIKPSSLGQASRIPGVSAADLSIIAVFLK